MMTQIKTFLINQGALFDTEDLIGFLNENDANDFEAIDSICPLLNLALLEVSGDDAVNFLQGQLTNDVKLLDGNNSHYSGYCSPKGRLLNLFLAFSLRGHIYLQLPLSQLEFILKRLRMFIMRSKVTISDQSHHIFCIGLAGPNATAKLNALFHQVPKNSHELITLEDATVIKMPGNLSRYQVYINATAFERVWNNLSTNCTKIGTEVWDYLEIQSGIPEIVESTRESFVPQMVNLDVINGINFKKGCYTGQEIVARTHYLGTVKRRTYLAHVDSKIQPRAGDEIHLNNHENAIGEIVRSAKSPGGGYEVLVEIRVENFSENKNEIVWQGSKLIFRNLPYQLV